MQRIRALVALLLLLSLVLAACGGSSNGNGGRGGGNDDITNDDGGAGEESTTTTVGRVTTTMAEKTTTSQSDGGGQATVVIDGVTYACQEIAALTDPCSDDLNAILLEFGDNLDAYVNSGILGPLDGMEYAYEDVAYAGILACTIQAAGDSEQEFIGIMLEDQVFADLTGVDVLPAWFGAAEVFCPGYIEIARDETVDPALCVIETGDMEGCFTYDTMQMFYDEAIFLVQEFLGELYADPVTMEPDRWLFVNAGDTGQEPCTARGPNDTIVFATYTEWSYEYCPTDETVYIGQESIWNFYNEAGDAGAIVAIAHETGHHIQNIAGVTASTQEEGIRQENQADCVAGIFTFWLDDKGYLDYEDDIADIDVVLEMIASAEDDPDRTHGTLSERVDSFVYGYQNGMHGCNEFFPDTPLLAEPSS